MYILIATDATADAAAGAYSDTYIRSVHNIWGSHQNQQPINLDGILLHGFVHF